mgnify:CR=1 FL=1
MSAVPKIEDDELRAEMTKHLCVLASGLLEVGCRDILTRYTTRRASPQVTRYVSSELEYFQNAKVGKIVELLTSFDATAATSWRASLSEEAADSIDSIVNNRHQIAHGRSIGLSFDVLRRYHSHATEALRSIEVAFPPT